MRHAYEWATLRVVPRVDRGEFVNAGVVVYCQALATVAAAVALDERRLLLLHPGTDVAAVRRHLAAVEAVCAGDDAAGEAARRPPGERFRRLVAPRSTVVQASPVHTGLTEDPQAELRHLLAAMVTGAAGGDGAGWGETGTAGGTTRDRGAESEADPRADMGADTA